MKLLRILAIPFTVGADIATLGNLGRGSFTQQLFDAEKHERECKLLTDIVKAACSRDNKPA